jgi:hypothetical protein
MSKSSSSEAILEGMVAVVLCRHAWTYAKILRNLERDVGVNRDKAGEVL